MSGTLKVIETNITYDMQGVEINDFQSRIIEINDWESYVKEIRQRKSVFRIGSLVGESFPKRYRNVGIFTDSGFHIRVDYWNSEGARVTKLSYLVRDSETHE